MEEALVIVGFGAPWLLVLSPLVHCSFSSALATPASATLPPVAEEAAIAAERATPTPGATRPQSVGRRILAVILSTIMSKRPFAYSLPTPRESVRALRGVPRAAISLGVPTEEFPRQLDR